MKILMCPPTFYNVFYEINPWMNKTRRVDQPVAKQQWLKLHELILRCEAKVELITEVPELPDLVFTANAGLIINDNVYLSRFRHPERQGEYNPFKAWFITAGYQVISEPAEDFHEIKIGNELIKTYVGPTFEGAGDALFAGNTLFAAYGFRTDKNYYDRFHHEPDIAKMVYCELIDPYFYHLDTCFCPLNANQALWWPDAFNIDTQKRMQAHLELFAVPRNEARRFACNSVVIEDKVIIPTGCPVTETMLSNLNFKVYSCEMDEFIKAGGACKCLTLTLT